MVMLATNFRPQPMDRLTDPLVEPAIDWLWHGYLARGNITLLTSLWKGGKTTLIAGLLRQLASGGHFLDLPCTAATALVVSEESRQSWATRLNEIPIGPHAQLLSRPFPARPSPREWSELIDYAFTLRAAGTLDLFVVDTLTAFLPGKSDSDPATLLEMLHPLRHLAECGVSVLVSHHPRRRPSQEGSTARGSGALLGLVDVILELHRLEGLASDQNRRNLIGLSRYLATPRYRVFEWVPGTPEFRYLSDVYANRFQENWEVVKSMLTDRRSAASHRELLEDWPPDSAPPTKKVLYQWLSRATREKLVVRSGVGTRNDPYRFRLRTEYDDYQLPELEPLPPLPPLHGRW